MGNAGKRPCSVGMEKRHVLEIQKIFDVSLQRCARWHENGIQDWSPLEWAGAKEVADTILYGLLLMARVGVNMPEEVLREVFNKKSEEYGFPECI